LTAGLWRYLALLTFKVTNLGYLPAPRLHEVIDVCWLQFFGSIEVFVVFFHNLQLLGLGVGLVLIAKGNLLATLAVLLDQHSRVLLVLLLLLGSKLLVVHSDGLLLRMVRLLDELSTLRSRHLEIVARSDVSLLVGEVEGMLVRLG